MSTAVRIGLFAVIVIGLVSLAFPRSKPAPAPVRGDEAAARALDADSAVTGKDTRGFRFETRERPPSDSLDGTDVAGALLVDDAGNFHPTADAIALFEYFLSATGENPLDDLVARIREEIRRRLSPPADAQALAFLDRYLLYRERAVALGAADGSEEGLRAKLDRLRALRREVFGEELAARLFGDEEAVAEVAIRQREVALDPELSDAEKAERIEKLYDELPEPMREARNQTLAAMRLRADEARIRSEGGTDEDIRELRVARFGEEAADRLEALDRRRNEWDSRLDAFRAERARILGDTGLTPGQRRSAVARLLADSFDESERVRVEVLDRIASDDGIGD